MSTMSDLHEFFADEFAMALLMPVKHLNRAKREGLSVIAAAKRFGVPLDVMHRRIESLDRAPDSDWKGWESVL